MRTLLARFILARFPAPGHQNQKQKQDDEPRPEKHSDLMHPAGVGQEHPVHPVNIPRGSPGPTLIGAEGELPDVRKSDGHRR